jgi:hypothetical protein
MGIRSLFSTTHDNKRKARKAERYARKLEVAKATGDYKDVAKYSSKLVIAEASKKAYLDKYKDRCVKAEKYNGFGSSDHREAWADLIKKAAKVGVKLTAPDFSKPPKKGKGSSAGASA